MILLDGPYVLEASSPVLAVLAPVVQAEQVLLAGGSVLDNEHPVVELEEQVSSSEVEAEH